MTIDEDDLDLDEDICLYQGQPFTGVAKAFHPNGRLKRELIFHDGFEQGPCRERYSNGQLQREWYAVRGVAEGKVCEWHETGQIKTIGNYSKGAELTFDEWDDAGRHVTHREIDWQSELGKYVSGSNP